MDTNKREFMIIDAIENGLAVTIEVEEPGSALGGSPATRMLGSSRGMNNRGRHERGMFHWNDLVTHEVHGMCRVIEEWGMFYSCRDCYRPCDGRKCNRCGGWTYQVSGYGVYDVVCPDGKTRSVHQQWLTDVSGSRIENRDSDLRGGVENALTPSNRLITGEDGGGEKAESRYTKPTSGSSAPPDQNISSATMTDWLREIHAA